MNFKSKYHWKVTQCWNTEFNTFYVWNISALFHQRKDAENWQWIQLKITQTGPVDKAMENPIYIVIWYMPHLWPLLLLACCHHPHTAHKWWPLLVLLRVHHCCAHWHWGHIAVVRTLLSRTYWHRWRIAVICALASRVCCCRMYVVTEGTLLLSMHWPREPVAGMLPSCTRWHQGRIAVVHELALRVCCC